MNPEEKALLERALELSEQNNVILKKLEKQAKWSRVWGIVKVAIFVLPFILGYFYLAPFIGPALQNVGQNYDGIKDLLNP
jgi:hypothetical protein